MVYLLIEFSDEGADWGLCLLIDFYCGFWKGCAVGWVFFVNVSMGYVEFVCLDDCFC